MAAYKRRWIRHVRLAQWATASRSVHDSPVTILSTRLPTANCNPRASLAGALRARRDERRPAFISYMPMAAEAAFEGDVGLRALWVRVHSSCSVACAAHEGWRLRIRRRPANVSSQASCGIEPGRVVSLQAAAGFPRLSRQRISPTFNRDLPARPRSAHLDEDRDVRLARFQYGTLPCHIPVR